MLKGTDFVLIKGELVVILYLCPVLVQLFVPWVILHVFLLLADFFKIKFFEKKKSFRNTTRV